MAAVDELALVPPPDDVVGHGGHEAVDGGGGGRRAADAAATAVGAADDADALLLGRAEHPADAAAAAAGLAIFDAWCEVRRLPGRRRRKSGGKTARSSRVITSWKSNFDIKGAASARLLSTSISCFSRARPSSKNVSIKSCISILSNLEPSSLLGCPGESGGDDATEEVPFTRLRDRTDRRFPIAR